MLRSNCTSRKAWFYGCVSFGYCAKPNQEVLACSKQSNFETKSSRVRSILRKHNSTLWHPPNHPEINWRILDKRTLVRLT